MSDGAAPFEVIALGVGDTFSARHITTSLILQHDGFRLGIDCPDRYLGALREASERAGRAIAPSDVDDMLITHVHGDHMNGLEGFGFFKFFAEKKRLRVWTTPEARAVMWDQRLRAPMEQLWDGNAYRAMGFDDYFEYRALSWTEVNQIGPFAVETRRTIHHVPTCALRVRCAGRTLGYSSDTAFDPGLIAFFADADLVIHETNYGPAHTPYESLAALPESTRAKMRLIHYSDRLDLAACNIAAVRQGEVLRV